MLLYYIDVYNNAAPWRDWPQLVELQRMTNNDEWPTMTNDKARYASSPDTLFRFFLLHPHPTSIFSQQTSYSQQATY